ncbi:MAG: TIGR01777 family oxidoreductase [Myxococcales bacterium]|nr:TIGR01777 family oxidoreductase [Myxococcales bacterium]
MKIVLAGGSGQVGGVLARYLRPTGRDVVVLTRGAANAPGLVHWSSRGAGDWYRAIDGADVVINLAGRSVNCRYTATNMQQMLDSRVDSTRAVCRAIAAVERPPTLWLQMSTATIYAHRFDAPNDEESGTIGGGEPDAPRYWDFSVQIAQAWERAVDEVETPHTRKVLLRTAMVMSPDRGGVFDMLRRLTRWRLGGSIGGGRQYVSWIHHLDFCRAIDWLIEHDELVGPVNLASPGPLPQIELMRGLREACHVGLGLPATRWMAKLGAVALRTDSELVLKSRWVIPGRLLASGFSFTFPDWPSAVRDLVGQDGAK